MVRWGQLGPKKNFTSCPGLVDHYTLSSLNQQLFPGVTDRTNPDPTARRTILA
jgi:hypothetical protein